MPSWYSRCSALPAFLQILPHQMHRPLLTKLDRWTVPYKTFLFIIQKEEQTPSNEAFGCANATRPHSIFGRLGKQKRCNYKLPFLHRTYGQLAWETKNTCSICYSTSKKIWAHVSFWNSSGIHFQPYSNPPSFLVWIKVCFHEIWTRWGE